MEKPKKSMTEKHNTIILLFYIGLAVVLFAFSYSVTEVFSKILFIASIFSLFASVYTGAVRFFTNHASSWAENTIVKPITESIEKGLREGFTSLGQDMKEGFTTAAFNATVTAHILSTGKKISKKTIEEFVKAQLLVEQEREKLLKELKDKERILTP